MRNKLDVVTSIRQDYLSAAKTCREKGNVPCSFVEYVRRKASQDGWLREWLYEDIDGDGRDYNAEREFTSLVQMRYNALLCICKKYVSNNSKT